MRVCLVRVLRESLSVRLCARPRVRARGCQHVRACVRACVHRYLLLRLHLEPALRRRDGRGRAVGRRSRRRVRPTLITTSGALHSHTNPSVRAAA